MLYCITCLCNHGYRIHPQQACILISGLTGVGKATVAKAVARACRVNLIQVSSIIFDHVISHDPTTDHMSSSIVMRLLVKIFQIF